MKSVLIKTLDAGEKVYAMGERGRGVYRLDPTSRSWVLVRDDTPVFASLNQFRRFQRRSSHMEGCQTGWRT